MYSNSQIGTALRVQFRDIGVRVMGVELVLG